MISDACEILHSHMVGMLQYRGASAPPENLEIRETQIERLSMRSVVLSNTLNLSRRRSTEVLPLGAETQNSGIVPEPFPRQNRANNRRFCPFGATSVVPPTSPAAPSGLRNPKLSRNGRRAFPQAKGAPRNGPGSSSGLRRGGPQESLQEATALYGLRYPKPSLSLTKACTCGRKPYSPAAHDPATLAALYGQRNPKL